MLQNFPKLINVGATSISEYVPIWVVLQPYNSSQLRPLSSEEDTKAKSYSILIAIICKCKISVSYLESCCGQKWQFFRTFMVWLRCPILNITAFSEWKFRVKGFLWWQAGVKRRTLFSLTYAKLSIVVQNIPILTCGKMLVIDKKCDRP